MLTLFDIASEIARKRKALRMNQAELAQKAGISRVTLEGLENSRYGELGFSKIAKILSVLGLELKIQAAGSRRPTLDELLEEERDDKGLDKRR